MHRSALSKTRGLFTPFYSFPTRSVVIIVGIRQDSCEGSPVLERESLLETDRWIWLIMIWFLILVYQPLSKYASNEF
jgi:hypothetical protein